MHLHLGLLAGAVVTVYNGIMVVPARPHGTSASALMNQRIGALYRQFSEFPQLPIPGMPIILSVCTIILTSVTHQFSTTLNIIGLARLTYELGSNIVITRKDLPRILDSTNAYSPMHTQKRRPKPHSIPLYINDHFHILSHVQHRSIIDQPVANTELF